MGLRMALAFACAAPALAIYSGSANAARLCKSLHSEKALMMAGITPDAATKASNNSALLDGDLKSGATMAPASGDAASAVFTGAFGTTRKDDAGLLITLPPGQVTVTITTYKDNRPVDTGVAATQADVPSGCNGVCEIRDGQGYFGIKTNAPFDQLRATVQVTGTSETTTVQELCGH